MDKVQARSGLIRVLRMSRRGTRRRLDRFSGLGDRLYWSPWAEVPSRTVDSLDTTVRTDTKSGCQLCCRPFKACVCGIVRLECDGEAFTFIDAPIGLVSPFSARARGTCRGGGTSSCPD